MLQSEFHSRVKMVVSESEYTNVIEPMYNACDVNKDEFCRLWAKMNYVRIQAYREQEKRQQQEEHKREQMFKIHNRIVAMPAQMQEQSASLVLPNFVMCLLEEYGFNTGTNEYGGYVSASSIAYQLGTALGIYKA